jgi:hypothetical protein
MLGRDADGAAARLARFVEVHASTLGSSGRERARELAGRHGQVDLRYPNGFALRVPEASG